MLVQSRTLSRELCVFDFEKRNLSLREFSECCQIVDTVPFCPLVVVSFHKQNRFIISTKKKLLFQMVRLPKTMKCGFNFALQGDYTHQIELTFRGQIHSHPPPSCHTQEILRPPRSPRRYGCSTKHRAHWSLISSCASPTRTIPRALSSCPPTTPAKTSSPTLACPTRPFSGHSTQRN